MKKLLFVLLIAIIACQTLQEVEVEPELEGINWKELWNKVKKAFQDAKNWLQENGLWDPLINVIKEKGRQAGINWCKGRKKIPEDTCISIVNWIIDKIH